MRGRWVRIITVVAVVLMVSGAAAAAGSGDDTPAVEVPAPQAEVVPASAPVVFVSTGLNFPDALGGGPVAALHDGPLLLVRTDSIPPATATELTRLNPDKIVVLGGTGVVSAGVETLLAGYTSGAVERLSGADRYETAAAISAANFPAPRITTVSSRSYTTTEILTCTSMGDLGVTIDTPVKGTIVLSANVQIQMNHVTGTTTYIEVGFGGATDDCSFVVLGFDGSTSTHPDAHSETLLRTVPISKTVAVSPGVHSFYVNAAEISGAGSSNFTFADMNAVFYPNP
jgi:hypothetical protein